MGMFDYYQPDPPLVCPECGSALDGWQGKDSECLLLTWRQNVAHPIVPDGGEDPIWALPDEIAGLSLPVSFRIHTSCDRHWIEAICSSEDGTWTQCRIDSVTPLPNFPRSPV